MERTISSAVRRASINLVRRVSTALGVVVDESIFRNVQVRVNADIENDNSCNNEISTTKYTLLTWLPVSLGQQFRRFANIFFLGTSLLMMIGTYAPEVFQSPLDPWSTVGTLFFVMMVTSAKEGLEDMERAKHDALENNRMATVVRFVDGKPKHVSIKARDIETGDIVKLEGKCQVPVDFLIVHTSNYKDGNTCYIETANIDGETNLKAREAPAALLHSTEEVTEDLFQGYVECELPNKNIHNFAGALMLENQQEAIALGVNNMIWRASIFSNTDWAYGIAVYCGEETKVQKNNLSGQAKMSRVEKYANQAIIAVFFIMVLTVVWSVISIYIFEYEDKDLFPYVFTKDGTGVSTPLFIEQFFVFFILFNNFIPISLYVTVEMMNVGQSFFIGQDKELYDESVDSRCIVKSSNMCQELGMVSNIFSDKTGTLTRNEMVFRRAYVSGEMITVAADSPTIKINRDNADFKQTELYAFLRCLATCHTVVREEDGYRAESPDELALVEGAVHFNFEILDRGTASMSVLLYGEKKSYKILAVNAFNSDRKRSSLLLHDESDDSYLLVCKGADSVMMDLCDTSDELQKDLDSTLLSLAREGLRTLVVAEKSLTKEEAEEWMEEYKKAAASIQDRDRKLGEVAAKIESGLKHLGLTAIEDRLQDEVPECIADFISAGIVVWMLTGDKEETAVEIAHSCNLVAPTTQKLFLVKQPNGEAYAQKLLNMHKRLFDVHFPERIKPDTDVALVVDGSSLMFFDENSRTQRLMLLQIGQRCRSVVACRLSPLQKQMLVNLVKVDSRPETVTLAIGDGANDVSMIKEANVGIGIIGKEGAQAANNADFAIGQFKFLRRLLFVHGRTNYRRAANVFLYSVHKNFVLTLTLVWFSYFAALTGTSLYESLIYTMFNIMLGLPIVLYGVFDKDVDDQFAMENPWIYHTGRMNSLLGTVPFVRYGINAFMYAVTISLTGYYMLEKSFQDYGLYEFGTHVFLGLIFSLQVKVGFIHHLWNLLHLSSMVISIVGTIIFVLIISLLDHFYGEAEALYDNNLFWLTSCFGVPIMCGLIDLIDFSLTMFFLEPSHELVIRETYTKVNPPTLQKSLSF